MKYLLSLLVVCAFTQFADAGPVIRHMRQRHSMRVLHRTVNREPVKVVVQTVGCPGGQCPVKK